MESHSFKKQNIIIDCKLKDSKCIQTNINKIGKNKIKKIKYVYVDSSERTKDETFNKFEKINDHKNSKQSNVHKNKKRLTQTNPIKKIRHNNYFLYDEDTTGLELKLANNKNYLKYNNLNYSNKNDFNSLLEWRAKTLDKKKDEKKYKIKLNIIDDKKLDKKDSNFKQKTNYNINTFNENDLINKIKNINCDKLISNCYKRVKIVSEDNNIIENHENHENNQNNKIKKNLKTNNIFCCVNPINDKNGINFSQSKMNAYTKMSEKIKYNIIEKNNQKIKKKKLSKKISEKIESKKNKRKMPIYNKHIKYMSDNYQTYNSEKNNINLNKNINSDENIDFLDVPQRRPGCSSKKTSKEIYSDLNSKNEKDSTYELLRKSEYLVGLHPRTTFTKTLKKTKKSNNVNVNSTSSQKEKRNLTGKIINSIIKKFKAKRFNIESYNKAIIKRNKYQNIKNDLNYINIQDSITRTFKKPFIIRDSKLSFIESNIKNNSLNNLSLNNNSFTRNYYNADYKKKLNKNSVIKRINYYIKNEKILTKDHKKSFTSFHTLSSPNRENKKEKNRIC